jgi:ABC-2 type transport system ATP-binding protein
MNMTDDTVKIENLPPTWEETIIWTKDLTMLFDGKIAVDRVNLQIPRGQIFGYIGPSGCGKTTTIRMLTGVYPPSAGEVTVFGHPPARFALSERERIGYMPQNFVLYPNLTVRENLGFAASMYGVSKNRKQRINELLDIVELEPHQNKLAQNISGGMQRRLSLAATLVHQPELIFLDEPTASIDPVLRRKFWDYFEDLRSRGVTLFVTTQYVTESAYCDKVGVMSDGKLLLVDTPSGLRTAAFGGEIIHIKTENPIDYAQLQSLNGLPFIKKHVEITGENEFRIVVENAATDIPTFMEWAQENNVKAASVDQFLPPFDDVFVSLIRSEGNV